MSEGELAKRIKQLNDDFPYDFSFGMGIGGILDEARKEFPTYEMAKAEYLRRVGETEIKSGLMEASIHLVLTALRDVWLLKWFGPDKEEKK